MHVSAAAGGTHSLICGALWHTVVARHNALTEAWLYIAARGGIAASCKPHMKQLPQRPRAMGFPALPTRPPPAPSAGGHMPARASPAAPGIPHPTSALAVPSTLHVTQAPRPPVTSASAAPPIPGDAAAAGHSTAVAPGEASAAAVPNVANAAAAPSAAVATATPAVAPPLAPNAPAPPTAAAAAHSGGATGTTRLPLRSQREPLLYLPGRPVVVDVCVKHPLASSVVAAAAWGLECLPKPKMR